MKKSGSFRQSNKGESLVLVTIFSTIVIGIVATLTVISAMLLYKAGAEKSHNQAYEIATSLSARIEELILYKPQPQIDLDRYIPPNSDTDETDSNTEGASTESKEYKGTIIEMPIGFFDGIPDASALVEVTAIPDKTNTDYYIVTVTATAARETYIKTTMYSGNASSEYQKIYT